MEMSLLLSVLSRGRYRTRTCDPLLVRNKRGLEYLGFTAPTPVFMRFWVPVVDGCFVLLRSGWCPRESFHLGNASSVEPVVCRHSPTYMY